MNTYRVDETTHFKVGDKVDIEMGNKVVLTCELSFVEDKATVYVKHPDTSKGFTVGRASIIKGSHVAC